MPAYKHILVAVDLSEMSYQILQQAKEIAQLTHADLSIIHVMEHSPLAYGGEFSIPIDANIEQMFEATARNALEKLASKFDIDSKHTHFEMGSVRVEVIKLAKEIKADLIVVATHGHHGIDVILGSRANAILHHAKCDVLAVRVSSPKITN